MRALLCANPGELKLVERPVPAPAPRSALIRLRRAGVCGTDLHIFEGTQPYFAYPRVIGHELSGEIEAAGEGGKRSRSASAVVDHSLSPLRPLRRVPAREDQLLPDAQRDRRAQRRRHGRLCLRSRRQYRRRERHQPRRSGDGRVSGHWRTCGAAREISAGQRVLVVGAGPIGVAVAIFAKARGAEVTALDTREDRLAFCRDGDRRRS